MLENQQQVRPGRLPRWGNHLAITLTLVALSTAVWWYFTEQPTPPQLRYQARVPIDSSGFGVVTKNSIKWTPNGSLEDIKAAWQQTIPKLQASLEEQLSDPTTPDESKVQPLLTRTCLHHFKGQPTDAYRVLEQLRALVERDPELAEKWLYTVIYYQGLTGLRQGENENCILCRGESSCILPISQAAVHTNPAGSRLAVKHFGEYLRQFPDDLDVRWLLNLAHMTLGEHPLQVDPAYRISLDRFRNSEFDIGKFRDIGHLAGVNRLNHAGGAIMEDFDNDGLLDILVTSFDPTGPTAYYRNTGDGRFEDRTAEAGLGQQLGGLNCVQADYDNDGQVDVFIPRGAWMPTGMRPSLLRNNGNGTFTDVTKEAGLLDPVNSISAAWADYDNDGHLDLFICCERQGNRLYRNKGNGTFEECAMRAGVLGWGEICKGCAWIDFDNDGFPDLFLSHLNSTPKLFRNNRNRTFSEVTREMGITGPLCGFSCWAWDYDNDGWLDILATSYAYTLGDVVKGILGQPTGLATTRLFRNLQGGGFQDVSREVGLDMAFATMGSNFGDFDNDGYLDFYLGTGSPDLHLLIPNRMFRNVAGRRFAEITGSSGTGQLQKGHGVACGDWDRDGNLDLFIQMGGAADGDRYHNILFQNPGQGNSWLTLKLVGKKSNRSALGARIKAVLAGDSPLTVCRHVTSGSSFGANPLQQMVGLGQAREVSRLEIYWPTSKTTQVFHNVAANQAIEVTEFAETFRKLDWKPIPWRKTESPGASGGE